MTTAINKGASQPKPAAQLTPAAARRIVSEIREHAGSVRRLLKELYDGRGWKALGYATWEACVAGEFDYSPFHVYKLIRCAEVDEDIAGVATQPAGVMQAVALSHVPRERRAEVYEAAISRAGGPKRLSARLIKEVAAERRVPKMRRPMGPEPRKGKRADRLEAVAPPAPGEKEEARQEREYDEIENRMPTLALALLYKQLKRFIPFGLRRQEIDRLRFATREELVDEWKALAREAKTGG